MAASSIPTIDRNSLSKFAFGFLLSLSTISAWGDISLPDIISDHMVLQRTEKVPIWGKADRGEEVSVTLGDQTVSGTAGENGKWHINLNLKESAPGPFTLTISGKNKRIISDVVIGEVWLASGQSNMDWRMKDTLEASLEIPKANNPWLRQFRQAAAAVSNPTDECQGSWEQCNPGSIPNFSAVAYHFQKELEGQLHMPVGAILNALGGTPCEAWTSEQALNMDPQFREAKDRWGTAYSGFPDLQASFAFHFEEWLKKLGREDRPPVDTSGFAAEDVNTADWAKVHLPESDSLSNFCKNGVVWLRREILLPSKATERPLHIVLGPIEGFVSIFWNGTLIRQTTLKDFPGAGYSYVCDVSQNVLMDGPNSLSLRIFSPVKPLLFSASAANFAASSGGLPIPLAGEWRAKVESNLPILSEAEMTAVPKPPAPRPRPQDVPGYLFNGMINPITPYAIRGVIWYQGETNTPRAKQYSTLFPMMILDWRRHWGRDDLPFYFCQLPAFTAKSLQPNESSWAELREAQAFALKLPYTRMAVLIDTGEAENIHPSYKETPGQRLALIALANEYGKKTVCSGPIYESMHIEAGAVRIRFSQISGGLTAKPLPETYSVNTLSNKTAPLVRNSPGSQVEGFAVCGADRKWYWADGKIDNNTVIVSSPQVPDPVAVRYAWASNPTCNLYNDAGLPAAPFRTDTFPTTTDNAKY